MSYEIDYGPQGTTLIQVEGQFFLAYQEGDTIFYWTLNKNELEKITDAPSIGFDSLGKLTTPIAGYQYYDPKKWEEIKDTNNLWAAGDIYDINNQGNVISGTIEKVRNLAETEPWGNDDRYINLVAEAMIEDPENWQSNLELDPENRFFSIINEYGYSADMFNRMKKYSKDKVAADALDKDGYNLVVGILQSLEATLDDKSIRYAATKWASGAWGNARLTSELTGATQKNSIYEVSQDFQNVIDNGVVGFSNKGEDKIQNLLDTYLPKELHAPYLAKMSELAGSYVNNPDFAKQFEDTLKNERYAFNSNWDKDIPWANIMTNAKTLVSTIWNVDVSEEDAIFADILTTNDINKQKEIIRLEGLKRGYANVTTDLFSDMTKSLGSGVIPIQDFRTVRGNK
jgi:hypothetical protein